MFASSTIAPTGHSSIQEPHAIQISVILTAIFYSLNINVEHKIIKIVLILFLKSINFDNKIKLWIILHN
ncbi:hypothetical protein B10973_12350 [Campylobacter lari]|nr:hypothetical protein B10973_12350 [Campylobacter lari]